MLRPYRSWFWPCCVGLFLALAGSGCSSIWARTRISDAETACTDAQAAGAAKRAPYEYTSALLYLEKAREEEAYARFGAAIKLGELSSQFAEKARAKASGTASQASSSTPQQP